MNDQVRQLLEFITVAKNILERHNIQFWLEGGTLLGAVRDNSFIPWEHDTDLGIWFHEILGKEKIIAEEFCDLGFCVALYEDYMHIYKNNDYWLDLNFYRSEGEYAVYKVLYPRNLFSSYVFIITAMLLSPNPAHPRNPAYLSSWLRRAIITVSITLVRLIPKRLKRYSSELFKRIMRHSIISKNIPRIAPAHYFKKLEPYYFYDTTFWTPAEKEEYLAYKYGKDWQTPRREWLAERDDLMVVNFHPYED